MAETFTVELTATAPYNFDLTIHKPAGWYWATPTEVYEEGMLWSATRFGDQLLGLKLNATGTIEKPKIKCQIYSKNKLALSCREALTTTLKRALKTDEDLSEFYDLSQSDDLLRHVVKDLYGMHTVGWPELFPALILAITLQMAPLKRSNQMMDLLIANFGEDLTFDNKKVRYWPSSQKIAETSVEELMEKAKLGYRVKNLKAIAATLSEEFPVMDELSRMSPDQVKKEVALATGYWGVLCRVGNASDGFSA
jgi:hypothetical protein